MAVGFIFAARRVLFAHPTNSSRNTRSTNDKAAADSHGVQRRIDANRFANIAEYI
jgi:hypothetical protein